VRLGLVQDVPADLIVRVKDHRPSKFTSAQVRVRSCS
jgi:hypothetical protein